MDCEKLDHAATARQCYVAPAWLSIDAIKDNDAGGQYRKEINKQWQNINIAGNCFKNNTQNQVVSNKNNALIETWTLIH